MDKLSGKIQNAELEVMKVLWEFGDSVPLFEIRRKLSEKCNWEDSTIKTLLRRLQAKGVIKLERRGVYSAVLQKAEYNKWSMRTFVDKLFAGSAKNLVASLLAEGELDQKDIEELSKMFKGGERDE